MTSYGLDTSVVVRLLVGVPEDQARKALDFVQDCSRRKVKVFVSDLVVQETWHALCHHYQVPVREAAGCLMDFLASGIVAGTGHALSVLQGYSGSGPGVADRMIQRDYLDHASSILTFDKEFSKLSHVKAL